MHVEKLEKLPYGKVTETSTLSVMGQTEHIRVCAVAQRSDQFR